MLFTGDLWQLKAIGGTAVFSIHINNNQARSGQKIWHTLNEFAELTENMRFKNDTSGVLQNFLAGARVSKVDENLLQHMNKRMMLTADEAKLKADPRAVWVAHKKEDVAQFNSDDFQCKLRNGVAAFRIVAQHTAATDLKAHPNEAKKLILYKTTNPQGLPIYIDIAIGSRVSCTQNLGTQIGK